MTALLGVVGRSGASRALALPGLSRANGALWLDVPGWLGARAGWPRPSERPERRLKQGLQASGRG